jgi:SAM-dependent methyltransferase
MKSAFRLFGIDVVQFKRAFLGISPFLANKRVFYAQHYASTAQSFQVGKLYPCLTDRFDEMGAASGAYFHQDLLAARLIYKANPKRHIDVGSRLDGFVAHVAAFREIEVFDIRPLTTDAKNIKFRQLDIMQPNETLTECTDSLSCLNVLEHFGLGRYGDPIDYEGHCKGFENLVRMLKPGGKFYFSVPIGTVQRFEFDAHRIFNVTYLLELFQKNKLLLDSFAYVDDEGALHADIDLGSAKEIHETFRLNQGCGIFELRKPI